MRSLNRVMVVAALASMASLAGFAAHAQDAPEAGRGMGPREHMKRPGMPGMMMERLKLTDEQKKKIEDIHYAHQKHAIAQRAEVETARLELGRLMHADEPNKSAIDSQIDRLAQLRAGLAKERIGAMLEVRGVLTPDQRKEWREMHGGMRGMHGWGHGMPGMRGPDGMGGGMHGGMTPDDDDDSDGPESGSDSM